MRALIQRVNSASVRVDDQIIGKISKGLLVLLAVEADDDSQSSEKMASKLLDYRVFNDHNNKMNLSVTDIAGELLVVSQFTLAAKPIKACDQVISRKPTSQATLSRLHSAVKGITIKVETGQFATDMLH